MRRRAGLWSDPGHDGRFTPRPSEAVHPANSPLTHLRAVLGQGGRGLMRHKEIASLSSAAMRSGSDSILCRPGSGIHCAATAPGWVFSQIGKGCNSGPNPCKCRHLGATIHRGERPLGRNVIFLSRGVLTPKCPSHITPLVDDATPTGAPLIDASDRAELLPVRRTGNAVP